MMRAMKTTLMIHNGCDERMTPADAYAHTAEEAIQQLQSQEWDCVLLFDIDGGWETVVQWIIDNVHHRPKSISLHVRKPENDLKCRMLLAGIYDFSEQYWVGKLVLRAFDVKKIR